MSSQLSLRDKIANIWEDDLPLLDKVGSTGEEIDKYRDEIVRILTERIKVCGCVFTDGEFCGECLAALEIGECQ